MLLQILILLPFIYAAISLITALSAYLFSTTSNCRVWKTLSDKFVLVTYSTTALGVALCKILAKKGIKLVLLGSNEDKLSELKAILKDKTDVVYHVIDISQCSNFSFLEKYDIGLVINQIGTQDKVPMHFIEQNIDHMIDFRLKAPLNLAKSILISMIERHKGHLVNIGFGSFGRPSPYFSLNSAIRTTFKFWSESMYYEMMKYNVNVEYMEIEDISDIDDKNNQSRFKPSIDKVAECVINTLGSSYYTIPYHYHFISNILMNMIPKSILGRYRNARVDEEMKRAMS